MRALLAFALVLSTACHSRGPAPVDDDLRYASHVALAPLAAALRASGGDPARIVRPLRARDLLALRANERFKFVLGLDRHFALAPLPASAPHNEYVHPVLADGAPVRTAGGLRVDHDGSTVRAVVLDPESRSYCTDTASLRAAVRALIAMGVEPASITVLARPVACVDDGAPPVRYGALMHTVGSRFEMLGRALAADNRDAARYALHELDEELDALPTARAPDETTVDLAPHAQGFLAGPFAALKRAGEGDDLGAFRAAWSATAAGCTGCHAVSGHGFLRVPTVPGEAVPGFAAAGDAGAR